MSSPQFLGFCIRCNRTQDEYGQCGNSAIPCPPLRPADPSTTITVQCAACEVMRVVPVEGIMHGKLEGMRGLCKRSSMCEATIFQPGNTAAAFAPPPPELEEVLADLGGEKLPELTPEEIEARDTPLNSKMDEEAEREKAQEAAPSETNSTPEVEGDPDKLPPAPTRKERAKRNSKL